MISFTKGDLLASGAYALVNTVNTVGVMGKGIALRFRETFPHNFELYAQACRNHELAPGKLLVVEDSHPQLGNHLIINFPTKTHWRKPSQYQYIDSGLQELVKVITDKAITSIAIPPLGCGNGGLDWKLVKPMIVSALSSLNNVDIHIYEPGNEAASILAQPVRTRGVRLTDARAMLLYAMFCYEMFDERSSLFVANKICYLYQIIGEESFQKLDFKPYFYGPYSVGVSHMLKDINGKYIHGLEEMNKKPFESIELDYGFKEEISQYVHSNLTHVQRTRIKTLLSIICGYESAYALEILCTVAYIRKTHPMIGIEDTIKEIESWSERKKDLFKKNHIISAYNHLSPFLEQ